MAAAAASSAGGAASAIAPLVHFVGVGRLTAKADGSGAFDDKKTAIIGVSSPITDSSTLKTYRDWFNNILSKAGRALRDKKRLSVQSGDGDGGDDGATVPMSLHLLAEWIDPNPSDERNLLVYYAVVTAKFKLASSSTELLTEIRDTLTPLHPIALDARDSIIGTNQFQKQSNPLLTALLARYNSADGKLQAVTQQLESVQRENEARLNATRAANEKANSDNAAPPNAANANAAASGTPTGADPASSAAAASFAIGVNAEPELITPGVGVRDATKRRKRMIIGGVVAFVVVIIIILIIALQS